MNSPILYEISHNQITINNGMTSADFGHPEKELTSRSNRDYSNIYDENWPGNGVTTSFDSLFFCVSSTKKDRSDMERWI